MDLFNKLVNTVFNPIIYIGVVGLILYFVFKEKKKMEALYTLVVGALVRYVANNIESTLDMLGKLARPILEFFSKILS